MVKLDSFDLKLLGELEYDSRQTLSQIAKKLNTSQQVISYRLKSLEKKEIISEYYTIIDLAKLGFTSFRTMIRFSNITKEKYKQIIDYLKNQKNILWIVDCGGRWDLLVNILAKNATEYYFLLNEIKAKFSNQIQNYDILLTVQGIYFGRNYFVKKRELNVDFSFGTSFENLEIDKLDLEILNFLSENARINAIEIANKLKVSSNTIILRIKEMKKNKIILGFKPLIHLERIEYLGYKALIKFQNISDVKEKEMINYLRHEKNVVGVIKLIGQWDFEIEFEVENQIEMLELTRKVRDKFKEIIKEFEIVPLYHEYKYNFFPRSLIDIEKK